uniref:TPR_REGION domain-containing protein n=2 Tax=Macrostomum lignano TaxID=282301 RepID=A0A1I8HR79_9PLAT
ECPIERPVFHCFLKELSISPEIMTCLVTVEQHDDAYVMIAYSEPLNGQPIKPLTELARFPKFPQLTDGFCMSANGDNVVFTCTLLGCLLHVSLYSCSAEADAAAASGGIDADLASGGADSGQRQSSLLSGRRDNLSRNSSQSSTGGVAPDQAFRFRKDRPVVVAESNYKLSEPISEYVYDVCIREFSNSGSGLNKSNLYVTNKSNIAVVSLSGLKLENFLFEGLKLPWRLKLHKHLLIIAEKWGSIQIADLEKEHRSLCVMDMQGLCCENGLKAIEVVMEHNMLLLTVYPEGNQTAGHFQEDLTAASAATVGSYVASAAGNGGDGNAGDGAGGARNNSALLMMNLEVFHEERGRGSRSSAKPMLPQKDEDEYKAALEGINRRPAGPPEVQKSVEMTDLSGSPMVVAMKRPVNFGFICESSIGNSAAEAGAMMRAARLHLMAEEELSKTLSVSLHENLELAIASFVQAAAVYEQCGQPLLAVNAYLQLAEALMLYGKFAEAAVHLHRATDLVPTHTMLMLRLLGKLATCRLQLSDPHAALLVHTRMQEIVQRTGGDAGGGGQLLPCYQDCMRDSEISRSLVCACQAGDAIAVDEVHERLFPLLTGEQNYLLHSLSDRLRSPPLSATELGEPLCCRRRPRRNNAGFDCDNDDCDADRLAAGVGNL